MPYPLHDRRGGADPAGYRAAVGANGFDYGPGSGSTAPGQAASYDDAPGHTRAFTVPGTAAADGAEDHVTTYRAGVPHPEVGAERLGWRELLPGIYRHPVRTFAQMRVHPVWGPALIVSALYGALGVFGIGTTRSSVFSSPFGTALLAVFFSALGFVVAGLTLGLVTQAVAQRLGGDGAMPPTVGLAMLVSWLTDAPRLLFAIFLGPGNGLVQLLGWATWLFCAALLTAMIRQVHELPWGKAAGAAAVQLIALLVLIKLPTLS